MKLQGIIETAIYADDLNAIEAFYRDVFGLRVIGKEPGRHVFFQVGESSVLLAFSPESTLQGDLLPAHGARGAGHFALGIDKASLDSWGQHLITKGVAVEQEVDWPLGGKSLYFRDPAGNLGELITPGIWGLPSGW
jgi:catechol 2,3-dioxygenase-like lactoylglutathione lyase family enzyme